MAKAPEGYVPKWMIAGKANTAVITEELLKEKSYEELPNFAKEFLEESKKEGDLLGMTTPSLGNLNIEPVKTNIVVHLSELWVILRRVVRFLVIAILFVALIPGFKDDKLSINPYEPAIIKILQIIVAQDNYDLYLEKSHFNQYLTRLAKLKLVTKRKLLGKRLTWKLNSRIFEEHPKIGVVELPTLFANQ